MTHNVHPYIHRLGIIKDWKSSWFINDAKKYREALRCDHVIRKFLEKRLKGMLVDDVFIEHKRKAIAITIKTARPGLLIGKSGAGIETLKKEIEKVVKKAKVEYQEIVLHIEEIKFIEPHAALVAETIVAGLEKRMQFRRLLKQTAEKVMANSAVKGVRIVLSGRLGGAEIARSEHIRKGRVPLQTFRSDIDYAHKPAVLSYGTIGVKVWVYRGDVYAKKNKEYN
ncbi:MAG: 30S ribosomal protein S3 [Candidatus Campbellbacteria bacterium]|nr:30S ribosomal protein S3 [Candidatus Campbellbacteria bacterium]